MDGLQDNSLSVADANNILDDVERHSLELRDKWYLLSMDWWRKFVAAVDSRDMSRVPKIDNSNLLTKDSAGNTNVLKKGLVERQDFIFVPCDSFMVLRDAFGVAHQQDLIERTVVNSYAAQMALRIEVYPITIRIARSDNLDDTRELEISSAEPLAVAAKHALEVLKIDANANFHCYVLEEGEFRRVSLVDLETLLSQDDLMVVIDELDEKGIGRFSAPTSTAKTLFGKSSSMLGNGLVSGNTRSASSPSIRSTHLAGLCGLDNLGNTCFMNSALQCLSNVRELTDYFRSDRYLLDINEDNVLGMHGQLARAYADLIQRLWSGNSRSVAPKKLKSVIGQYAVQFNGYSQHDSQELLNFLLDGLHEDLNRVKKKKYVEAKDSNGRPDPVVADEAWQMYKMGNDSIIVDYLHGQLKSTVVCPKCALVSIKFDPFCFLSVPLPPKDKLCKVAVTFIPLNQQRSWIKCSMSIARTATVSEVRKLLNVQLSVDSNSAVVFALVINKSLSRIMAEDEALYDAHFPPTHQIYAYEVLDWNRGSEKQGIVQVRNVLMSPKEALTVPLLITVPSTQPLTQDFITNNIMPRLKAYFARERMNGSDVCNGNEDENANEEDSWRPVSMSYSDLACQGEHLPVPEGKEPLVWPTSGQKGPRAMTVTMMWQPNTVRDYRKESVQERELIARHATKKPVPISDCFDLFTRQELLSEDNLWYCPRCKGHQRATKKLDLWRLPPILIVHLKRFHFTRWSRDKVDLPVLFPLAGLDLTDRVIDKRSGRSEYDLIAVSNHMGGLGGGHYTAWARNGDDWYDFNDSQACWMRQPDDDIVSKEAYVLFYRRRVTETEANMEVESED